MIPARHAEQLAAAQAVQFGKGGFVAGGDLGQQCRQAAPAAVLFQAGAADCM